MDTLLKQYMTKNGTLLGILDTPCHPNRYYAGSIGYVVNGESYPKDNSTHKYHRTIIDATRSLLEIVKLLDE
jgi:hypothetical protein